MSLCEMMNGENPYLSNEGMPNRCAFPLAAQKIIHVSCRIWGIAKSKFTLLTLRSSSKYISSPVLFPQNLCWMQAVLQTELVLSWAYQTESGQGLPTSQLADRHPPGPSSLVAQDWGCKREVVEERSHVVGFGGRFHTWDGAVHPHRVEDYHQF